MARHRNQDPTPATTTEPETQAAVIDPAVALYRAEAARKAEAAAARKAARNQPVEDGQPRRLASGRLSARGLPCLCGCGASTTQREARFLSGHDARMRSAIIKGGLDPALIPSIARPFFEDGPIAGLLLADAGTESERLVDVKNGGWA